VQHLDDCGKIQVSKDVGVLWKSRKPHRNEGKRKSSFAYVLYMDLISTLTSLLENEKL
jgi:hypothetical protein